MTEALAKGVAWDLTDLYFSIRDPKIDQDLGKAEKKAKAFEKKYKKAVVSDKNLKPSLVAKLVQDYKEIATLLTKPSCFSYLVFAQKTNASGVGAFLQKIRVRITDIQSHLLFWEVGWSQLNAKQAKVIMEHASLIPDRHYLEKARTYAPYTLKENEEKIMAIKDNTSGSAFARLFDEIMNSIPFYIDYKGKREKKTEGEILNLLHSPAQAVRKQASLSLAEGLEANTHALTYIFNMILADRRANLKIRGYQHPMDAMNLSNEISMEMVTNLMRSVKKAYPIARRYYDLKRRILGLTKLYDYDRYAPIETSVEPISFEQCKQITLEGYRRFSPKAAEIVTRFFKKHWIDAEVRDGKQNGGFCMETTPDLHPYILVNYTGSLRDVMTVAHECGHGLHQYLARRAGILESHAPLTMAECASVFGEMLIFEQLLQNEQNPEKQLALICGKIDDNFATVFRQVVMTDFEIHAHEIGMTEGELSSEQLSDIWIQVNAELYGKSVKLTDAYRHGWKYIPHFIHSPFYCYAYSFAQLFVLSLYQQYKKEKEAFIPQYFEMLSVGGSRRPEALAKIVGLDLSDPNFWQLGLQILDNLVGQAENLAHLTSRKN